MDVNPATTLRTGPLHVLQVALGSPAAVAALSLDAALSHVANPPRKIFTSVFDDLSTSAVFGPSADEERDLQGTHDA